MSLNLKRHIGLVISLLALTLVLVFAFGNIRIKAYSNTKTLAAKQPRNNINNRINIFDDSIMHHIKIIAAADTQKRMLKSYQITGDKDFFVADVIIDSVRVKNIGIRLKGNASLKSVAKADNFVAALFLPPELKAVPSHCWAFSEFPPPPGLITEDKKTSKIPYLIKFDEFVEGQSYLGYTELAIRTSGVGYDAAQLQEPLTNYSLEQMGLAASKTAYTSFQFNNNEKQVYTIAEVLDQRYIDEHFVNNSGVLFKVVEVGNDFKYLGSDLSLYANIFEQKTAKKQADMSPLMKFMDFVSNSDKQSFDSELSDWLDTDKFAKYLAVENLLVNFDSLAGMGNNYYLYFDDVKKQFTVLAWDANESLGKLAKPEFKLDWSDRFTPPDITAKVKLLSPEEKKARAQAMTPECSKAFAVLAEKLGPPNQAKATKFGPPNKPNNNQGIGPFGDGKQILKDRFLASPKFNKLYQDKLKEAYQKIFVQDLLTAKITDYKELINSQTDLDGFDFEDFNRALEATKDFLRKRYEYLKTTNLSTSN